MEQFSGKSANELWTQVAARLASIENLPDQPSRVGATKELLHVGLSLENPRARWVTARQPPMNVAFALAEVVWILSGRQDAAFLLSWNKQLPQYVGGAAHYHGAYGYRLRHHFDVDQLERVCDALLKVPETRQVVLQMWDPRVDLPGSDGQPTNPDIPCNVMSLLKLRRGQLEWLQITRSNDLFRGLPYNLVQFTMLQEVIAGWVSAEVGRYDQVIDSLHVYKSDWPSILATTRVPESGSNLSFALGRSAFQSALREVIACAEAIATGDLSEQEMVAIGDHQLPESYANIVHILAAEAIRRRRGFDAALAKAARCTDALLSDAWLRWFRSRPTTPEGLRAL
jgi:thymidylate synthase